MSEDKPYKPAQEYRLPPSPREWLRAGHLAYFIDAVVEELDLSQFCAAYEERGVMGQRPYHPRMMVKVWLYTFARGIRATRKVEEALHEDVGFRMLSGNPRPASSNSSLS